MKNKNIILAGGTGFVGQQLATEWSKHNKVTVLTRNIKGAANNTFGKATMPANVQYLQWDGKTIGPWAAQIDGCDLLVNLAGRSVNCRYNEANKTEIINSRIDATHVLGQAVKQMTRPPELFIQVTSATIYRHAEDRPQDEATGEIENDFSVQVCKAWEQAIDAAHMPHTRKAVLRMAIVLGKGGVLVPYGWLARLGVGGRHGDGRQMFSWVHMADVQGVMEWLADNKRAGGVYNVSSPHPVTNSIFMKTLRQIYNMPVGIPAPEWLLKVAAFIQGTETELLLKSRWVLPARLLNEGYKFQYPDMQNALKDLL